MITKAELKQACDRALEMIEASGIKLTDGDKNRMTAAMVPATTTRSIQARSFTAMNPWSNLI